MLFYIYSFKRNINNIKIIWFINFYKYYNSIFIIFINILYYYKKYELNFLISI